MALQDAEAEFDKANEVGAIAVLCFQGLGLLFFCKESVGFGILGLDFEAFEVQVASLCVKVFGGLGRKPKP